jgi:hypothetical protein
MTAYGNSTYPGSRETLTVIERFTLKDADHLEYRYTVSDPETYSRPYTVREEYERDDSFVVVPEICHENNKDLGAQLAAGRADEANAQDAGLEFSLVRMQRLAETKAAVEAANKK